MKLQRVFKELPSRLQIGIVLLAAETGVLSLWRMALFIGFRERFPADFGLLAQAFWVGLRLDFQLVAVLWLLWFWLSFVPPLTPRQRAGIWFTRIYWLVVSTLLNVFYAFDLGYFAYQNTRLEISALALLRNTATALRVVWETYPVLPALVGLGLWFWLSYKGLAYVTPLLTRHQSRWRAGLSAVLASLIVLALGYGKWSRYPLRWSDAFFAPIETVNQLAVNPVLYFGFTAVKSSAPPPLAEVKRVFPAVARLLELDTSNRAVPDLRRTYFPPPRNDSLNVVLVFLETCPTFKLGYFGNPLNPSPTLDSLARAGVIYTNFFVPKFSTAASIFSALTGLPDVSIKDKAATRNPQSARQSVPLAQLEGYDKHFFLGGSANWGDIGGFFRNNVPGVRVHQEGEYRQPELNAWGISDWDLFQEAHKVFRRSRRPFFAVLLTADHHPPYSIPHEVPGFKVRRPEKGPELMGFSSWKEYNSFRFMDYAVKTFLDSASGADYFAKTLFVFLGDHGFDNPQSNSPWGSLSGEFYQVPCIFYGPQIITTHAEKDWLTSEIDLLPTILWLLGRPFTVGGLGRPLWDPPPVDKQVVYWFSAAGGRSRLLTTEFTCVTDLRGKAHLFRRHENELQPLEERYPSLFQELKQLTEGFYLTSAYFLFAPWKEREALVVDSQVINGY